MTRRSMTLLETVLALALLGGLAVASVAWTTSAVSSSRRLGDRANWESAAQATLRLIERDLATGDAPARTTDRSGRPTWLQTDKDSLRIRVRTPPYTGDEHVTYRFDPDRNSLIRSVEVGGAQEPESLLIGELAEVHFELVHGQAPHETTAFVRVGLTSADGLAAARRFRTWEGARP